MITDFLPKKPAPVKVKIKDWPGLIRKKVWTMIVLTYHLFILYEISPRDPNKEYPKNSSEFSQDQRRQCLEIFKRSEHRVEILERKASTLFQTVNIMSPLFIAVMAYLWKNTRDLSLENTIILISLTVPGLLCLLGAIFASLRVNYIRSLYVPGLQAIIDTEKEALYKYDAQRDGYGLLWCANMNEATSDLRADFLRAGQMLISLALFLLFFLSVTTIFLIKPQASKPTIEQEMVRTNNTLVETIGDLKQAILNCENQLSITQSNQQQFSKDISSCQQTIRKLENRLLQLERKGRGSSP